MARLTKQAQAERQELIDSHIMQHLLDGRWSELTFKSLEASTGIRSSTIQGYYKFSEDFIKAIQGKVFPWFLGHLDMTTVETFRASWIDSLQNEQFRNVLAMMLSTAMAKQMMATKGLIRLSSVLDEKLGEKGVIALRELVGITVFEIATIFNEAE